MLASRLLDVLLWKAKAVVCHVPWFRFYPENENHILEESIRAAMPFFQQAEDDYTKTQIILPLRDVQYFLAVMYDNLGMVDKRDEAAARHQATDEKMKRWGTEQIDPQFKEVMEIVSQIGRGLAKR
jgi:anaphase-promoting complex subunit 5